MSEMLSEIFYSPMDQAHIKRERAKSQELKNSQWWKQLLGLGICHYCQNKFEKTDLTMDHILAIGRGGKSTKGNVVVCCKACNTEKAHKTPAELALENLHKF